MHAMVNEKKKNRAASGNMRGRNIFWWIRKTKRWKEKGETHTCIYSNRYMSTHKPARIRLLIFLQIRSAHSYVEKQPQTLVLSLPSPFSCSFPHKRRKPRLREWKGERRLNNKARTHILCASDDGACASAQKKKKKRKRVKKKTEKPSSLENK